MDKDKINRHIYLEYVYNISPDKVIIDREFHDYFSWYEEVENNSKHIIVFYDEYIKVVNRLKQ